VQEVGTVIQRRNGLIYILDLRLEGMVFEKREMPSCLKNKLVLINKKLKPTK